MEVRNKVRSIAHDLDVAKITVVGVPDRPGIAAAIFEPLAKANISIDTIVQNASIDNITDLTFTVAKSQLDKAMKVAEPIAKSIGARQCISDSKLGKVSIIGTGMQNTPGYAARMFATLSERGMLLCRRDQPAIHQATRAREVYDVTGAGDTVIAMMALARAANFDDEQALQLANHAAGVVVSKLGTATASLDEIMLSLEREKR